MGEFWMRILRAVIVAACLTAPVKADDGFGTKLGMAGKWTVYFDTDQMSDEKQCTALYDDRAQVQLTPTSLAIGYRGRGGISGYRIRLDDAPALPLQPATSDEESMGVVFIGGHIFNEVLAAKRVRVQALTVLNTIIDEDIDLSSVEEVKRLFTQAGCTAR
jgi:hypothetical protein